MWAGQALFEAANGLQNAIDVEKAVLTGRRVNEGGRKGRVMSSRTRTSKREKIKSAITEDSAANRDRWQSVLLKNVASHLGMSEQ